MQLSSVYMIYSTLLKDDNNDNNGTINYTEQMTQLGDIVILLAGV